MITLKRSAILNWKNNPTAFEIINEKSLISFTRKLGTALGAVNKMLSSSEEMEILLPEILGVSPNSNATDWQQKLESYWHNFFIDVPKSGKTFDTSLVLDITNYKRKDNIKTLKEELDIKPGAKDVEKTLMSYIEKNVEEERKYKYLTPINVEDYLAWRYCFISSEVANEPEMMNNSNKIRFYLIDESRIKLKKDADSKLRKDAIGKYYASITGTTADSIIENLLIASNKVLSLRELKDLSTSDRENLILDMATTTPKEFIELIDDKWSADKAEVKKWTMAGFIRQLANSSIYVDASDPKIVLGNTLDEVITYVNNEINAAYVNQLRLKFKNL